MPHFQGSVDSLISAADRAQRARPDLAEKQLAAVDEATQRYEAEMAST
jgi:limonene 1,2-monooxygenase